MAVAARPAPLRQRVCTDDFSSFPLLAGDGAVISSGPFDPSGIAAVSASNVNDTLWSSTVSTDGEAMAGFVVYAQGPPQNVNSYVNYDIYAFDAGGSAGCSGTPVKCAPLWSAPGFSPVVANGYVYAGITNSSSDAEIVAYGLP